MATLSVDMLDAVEKAWAGLLDGEGGISLGIPLTMTDKNEELFSPGRQQLVEKLRDELVADYIDTGVDPLTGEPR